LIGQIFFKVLCFKTPLQRRRAKGMGTGAGGTLSERPDVRVRAAAVNMAFVRASAAGGRVAGRPFFWYFSLSAKEKYEQKIFKFLFYSIPRASASLREAGFSNLASRSR
jgi:hypothetical protein